MNSSFRKKTLAVIVICLMMLMSLPAVMGSNEYFVENLDGIHLCESGITGGIGKDYFEVYDIAEFGQTVYGLTSADFNNDGYLDFAVSWTTCPLEYSGISIFYNNGSLGFIRDDVYVLDYTYIDSLDSGDYDNDGDVDLLFSYSPSRGSFYVYGVVSILFNDGGNNFGNETVVAVRGLGLPRLGQSRIHPKITSADYDKDGDIDLLVGDNSGKVEFYKNNGAGKFKTAGIIYDFGIGSWGLTSADFNDDGDIDFVVAAEEEGKTVGKLGHFYLKLNTGSPKCFERTPGEEIANPGSTSGLTSLDYDNDGKMDVIGGPGISLYMNEYGKYQFFYVGYRTLDIRAGGLTSGDFNNDGWDDFIAGGTQGVVRLFINNYGQFPPTEPIITGEAYGLKAGIEYEYTFTVADINKDDVYLYVEWGDYTNSEWLGPYDSGENVVMGHTWHENGTYTIRSKAKDIHGEESDWATSTVSTKTKKQSTIFLELTGNIVAKKPFSQNLDGNTLYVGGNGSGNYTTIQDAVDAASEGDTIFVYSGTYYENLQIDKTITLTGEDKNNTVIDGDSSGNVVNVTADSVTFNGFTVRNGDVWDAGIYVYDSHGSCIFDCIVSSNNGNGIELDLTKHALVSNCIISSNGGNGIELDLTKHALVSNCIISSNKRFGVLIYASDGSRPHSNNNIVSNCIISNNDEGIFLDDFNGNSIIGNNITGNHVYGIHLAFVANNIVKENNFIDNNRNAYFEGSFCNSWSKNYWDNWIGFGPKIICGNLLGFIPLINFDWHPASEPYDMGVK